MTTFLFLKLQPHLEHLRQIFVELNLHVMISQTINFLVYLDKFVVFLLSSRHFSLVTSATVVHGVIGVLFTVVVVVYPGLVGASLLHLPSTAGLSM